MKVASNHDFERAFQRTKSAVRLCMGLIEAANGDSGSDEKDLWVAVDAIIENSCRDVKDIWKARYSKSTTSGLDKILQQSRS